MSQNDFDRETDLAVKANTDRYPYMASDDFELEKLRQKHIREHRAAAGIPPLKMPLIGEREPGDESD